MIRGVGDIPIAGGVLRQRPDGACKRACVAGPPSPPKKRVAPVPAIKLTPDLLISRTYSVSVTKTLASDLSVGGYSAVIVESYSDVDPGDVRAIVKQSGAVIQENPDLLANHLIVWADEGEVRSIAGWNEVAYSFPAFGPTRVRIASERLRGGH
jgi:hypothetical protein